MIAMIVDGAQTIAFVGLARRRDFDLLSNGAPHGTQDGQPTDIEFIRVVEDIPGLQLVASVFNRLFLT